MGDNMHHPGCPSSIGEMCLCHIYLEKDLEEQKKMLSSGSIDKDSYDLSVKQIYQKYGVKQPNV